MNNIDYPNPVLSAERDDYCDGCEFDVSFKEENITVDDQYINIPAVCNIKCDGLQRIITEGKAAIVVLINSPAAFYRRTIEFEGSVLSKTIQIPKYDVKKDIHFCGYILAKTDIEGFRCDGEFNDLYFHGVPSFNVKKANVLAEGRTRIIPIDDSELEKPISSIFSIRKNTQSDAEIESDFDSDEKIVIYLNERLNQLYYDIKDFNNGALHRYLNGIIVFPVLIEAISKMCEYYKGYGIDYTEKRWFRAIDRKLSDISINLAESYDEHSYTELADKLLGNIAYDGLFSVKATIDEEANSGEYNNLGGID